MVLLAPALMPDASPPDPTAASDPSTDQAARFRRLLHSVVARAAEVAPRAALGDRRETERRQVARAADEGPVEAATRDAMRMTCAVARETGIPIERLLVQLKEAWALLPHSQRITAREGDVILPRVVTLCINEFYAADAARQAPRADHLPDA